MYHVINGHEQIFCWWANILLIFEKAADNGSKNKRLEIVGYEYGWYELWYIHIQGGPSKVANLVSGGATSKRTKIWRKSILKNKCMIWTKESPPQYPNLPVIGGPLTSKRWLGGNIYRNDTKFPKILARLMHRASL